MSPHFLLSCRPALLSLVLALAMPLALAGSPDRPPPKIDFKTALGIDAKTAEAVDKVLREQQEKRKALHIEHETSREKMDALRRETDNKLAALLSAEQMKKLHDLQPRPPRPNGPPPPPRP